MSPLAWLQRLFRRERPSLVRELVRADLFAANPAAALLDAALLVRRAGLEHLVQGPTRVEVEALARAGELVTQERLADLVAKLRHPAAALAPFDDGRALTDEVFAAAFAASREEN